MLTTLLLAAILGQPQVPPYMIDSEGARHASMAVFAYAREHNNQLPPDMASIMPYMTGDLSKASPEDRTESYRRSFFSSQDKGIKIPDDATPQWLTEHSSFAYLGAPGVSYDDLPSWNDLAIMHVKFDKGAPTDPSQMNPEGRLYVISFIDGHTEAMTRGDAERIISESTAIFEALRTGKPLPGPSQTVADLRAISQAIHAFAKAHEDNLPPDLGTTLAYVPSDKRHATAASRAAVFLSVEAQKATHIPDEPTPEWVNEHGSYVYLGSDGARLARVEDPMNTILVHGKLDAPIDLGPRGRRGLEPFGYPVLSAAGEGSLQREKFTRWIIDVSKKVIESARTGAPLPDHLNALRDCRLIGDACMAYAKAHDNILPPDLGATLEYLKLDEGATVRDKALIYLSPRAERSVGIPDQVTPEWINRYSDYVYLGAGVDRKLAMEASVQLFLHGPLDEAWDIMDRGAEVHAVVESDFWGQPLLADQEYVTRVAKESKESLDAIRAGIGK
jgi:hypothetical protein